jgi:hypothetical protein
VSKFTKNGVTFWNLATQCVRNILMSMQGSPNGEVWKAFTRRAARGNAVRLCLALAECDN